MKNKKFWLIKPIHIILILVSLLLTASIFFVSRPLFFVALPIVLICVGFAVYRMLYIERNIYEIITGMGRAITDSHDASLINFPLPSLIVSEQNEILWHNDMFKDTVIKGQGDVFGKHIQDVFGKDIFEIGANQGIVIEYNESFYEVFSIRAGNASTPLYMVYLVNITVLQTNMNQSLAKRPVVMMVLIDNYEEVAGNENDMEDTRLIAEVRNTIQEFVDKTTGFIRRLGRDRYLMIVEKQHLDEMMHSRFDVLDKTRELSVSGRVPVTLSIGVAVAETTLVKAEKEARQALDMALGRGGDQAVIKTENGYEFFGGYSKGVEKRTKVKTRIVASAMVELIKSAENILIMGHKFADLDSLGSAIGLSKAIRCFDKKVNIVLDTHRNLADCMVQRLVENGEQNLLLLPQIALETVTEHTLLIVTDTHALALLESEEIYRKCKQVVVIDHHRKVVKHIDNAVIFYHEPYASSASEMVAELIQYFGESCTITHFEAEALLAGIMLDTKSFIIRTGVRTFEAAAYLRRLGADTVEVRKLFASSMDIYQKKIRVVSGAGIYKQCAVAICDFSSDDLRIIAPQAADELLGINDVKASFVLYEQDNVINVSARSMGALNVQVIMEKLGGGGHHTMAGAQIPNTTCDKVRQSLFEIIDEINEREKTE